MFKGINVPSFTPPPPPPPTPGLLLCFGSELGGGVSSDTTDNRDSCLKKSAGERCGGGSRLACVPGGCLLALHTHMGTHRSTHVPTPALFLRP